MGAQFEVRASIPERLLRVRLSGIFTKEDMLAWAAACRLATDQFRGEKHMVIADMRGLKPLHPHIARILGEEIGYGRSKGAVLCAHLSDHTVQRLQAARLARESSPTDDVTVDVSSLDEAHRVIAEARSRLDDERYEGSIRDALASSR